MSTRTTKGEISPNKAAGMPAVPSRLATPANFASADVAAISQALNGLVADAFALYIKTKNFHWHLSGVHFRDLHLLFDEQAEAIFESIDLMAERVRRIGGLTIHSVGQVAQLMSVQDDDDRDVPPLDMVRRLRADNQHMADAMRAAHETCSDSRDFATTSILETLIDEAERRVWFLFEIQQGLEKT